MILAKCGPIMQPSNLIILSPEQLIPPLELGWKQGQVWWRLWSCRTALQNRSISPFFTLCAEYCNPHCYRQQLVRRTGPDWQRVALVVTITWKIIIQGQWHRIPVTETQYHFSSGLDVSLPESRCWTLSANDARLSVGREKNQVQEESSLWKGSHLLVNQAAEKREMKDCWRLLCRQMFHMLFVQLNHWFAAAVGFFP